MMKNRKTRLMVNGGLLVVLAAIGIAAFRLGTSTMEELSPEEPLVEMAQTEEIDVPREEPLVDAGTDQVEASMEEDLSDEEEPEEESGLSEEDGLYPEETGTYQDSPEDRSQEAEDASAQAVSMPELNFSEETLMQWPVRGTILLDYNMEQTTYFPTLDQYRLSPAIAVQAVEGAPVMAAAEGKVFSVEEKAETGTTVTMELGSGYQAIYGQLQDLTVEEGDLVEEGEIIGYVGTPTKYYSKEGSNLYFAMKRNGKPVDPILYLP